jgi:hypothetical protein
MTLPMASTCSSRLATIKRPWLFLDVDGVASPIPPPDQRGHRNRTVPAGYRTWPRAMWGVYVHDDLAAWRRELVTAFEVIWTTDWQQHAPTGIGDSSATRHPLEEDWSRRTRRRAHGNRPPAQRARDRVRQPSSQAHGSACLLLGSSEQRLNEEGPLRPRARRVSLGLRSRCRSVGRSGCRAAHFRAPESVVAVGRRLARPRPVCSTRP